jgi:hypothetical protein
MELTLYLTLSQFLQTFLTNPSKLRIYLCKIPTVTTETLTQNIYSLPQNMKIPRERLPAFRIDFTCGSTFQNLTWRHSPPRVMSGTLSRALCISSVYWGIYFW